MRAVLVGECPGARADSGRPLPGLVPGSAGWRMRRWCGISERRWALAPRVNLFPLHVDRWSAPAARSSAENLCESLLRGRRLVLLGRRVGSALGGGREDFGDWFDSPLGPRCVVIPHPSGLNHIYNSADCRDKFSRLVGRALMMEK